MTAPVPGESPERGPYLIAALFCERTLQEQDGTLSAVRIVNQITYPLPEPTEGTVPIVLPEYLTLLILLVAGAGHGDATIRVLPELPDDRVWSEFEFPVSFEAAEQTATLRIDIPFDPQVAGLYWFGIFLGDTQLTRVPLRVVHRPAAAGTEL